MIETFSYVIIVILFAVAFFFLIRTLIIALSMFGTVPYVPSTKLFKEAIKYLDLKEGDKVLDIGSGDGRVLIYASKVYPKVEFVGVEKNFLLVMYSNAVKFLLGRKNLIFKNTDARDFDISDFDAIYLYLLPDFVDEILLKKKIKKGCRVISFHFPLGKKFRNINKISKYPVKYGSKQENIYKWVNNGNIRR
jgi:protein-L-isoaspartate O-methyltransferase